MKRILLITLIVFMVLLCDNTIVNAKEVYFERTTNVIVKQDLEKGYMVSMIRKFVEYKTKHLLFSVELFKDVYDANALFEISNNIDVVIDEVKKIAYVTEILYNQTNDLNYVGVGQKLIWEKLSSSDNVYFLENKIRNDNLYLNYISSINNEIDKVFPEFNFNSDITLNLNEVKEFYDEALSDYEIVSVEGESVSSIINENKLILRGNSNGLTKITLKKDISLKDYDMKYFENEKSTDLISCGNFSLYKTINVNVTSGNLILNILDDNIIDDFKVSYGIFKEDKLVYQFDITKAGMYKVELPYGDYIVKELSINSLYEKDNKKYKISIKNNKDVVLDLMNNLLPKENVIFEEIENTYQELPVYDNVEISIPDTSKNANYSFIYCLILYVIKKILF